MRHGGWPDRKSAFRWLLLLGLAGAAAMILADWAVPKPTPPAATDGPPSSPVVAGGRAETSGHGADPFREYEEAYQKKLKELLENIAGVGEVDVSVTIDSTEETVLQQNERDSQQTTDEQDAAGTKRRTTQITREGQIALYETSASQTPVVVKKIKPRIRGVVVVADGAGDAVVRARITEAVSRGLDVPAHRISVLPRRPLDG